MGGIFLGVLVRVYANGGIGIDQEIKWDRVAIFRFFLGRVEKVCSEVSENVLFPSSG